jgi:hypothetical protein
VLVVDETGDVKKGTATAGVQRQYTGTAGRIENAQVAVYLVYAVARDYAFIDRALYLPRSWAGDRGRCRDAGVPDAVGFATKPALALVMIIRAVTAGAPVRWAAGGEVYGNDPKLRAGIAACAWDSSWPWPKTTGSPPRPGPGAPSTWRSACRPPRGSSCPPATAPRARALRLGLHRDRRPGPARRQPGRELAADPPARPHRSRHKDRVRLLPRPRTRAGAAAALVAVAGTRWKIEEGFAGGKELAALDQHQVRSWTSSMRWTILAMLAHAFLSVMTAAQPAPEPDGKHRDQAGHELIPPDPQRDPPPLRRHALPSPARPRPAAMVTLARRRHQATARNCHYQRHQALTVT